MDRMSPNQSEATTDKSTEGDRVPLNDSRSGEEGGYRTSDGGEAFSSGVGNDPLLTTDCPSYADAMHRPPSVLDKQRLFLPKPPTTTSPPSEDNDGSENGSTPSQKITIESIKEGHSDGYDDDDSEDDRSSVVTESSVSEYGDHVEGNERLRRTADTLAVDAINCASDELQCSNKSGVICVNSELGATRANGKSGGSGGAAGPLAVMPLGGVNNGYLMSEVGKPSRSRESEKKLRNGKELMVKDPHVDMVPMSSTTVATATTTSPSGQQTTAIFNDSTDITVGNKTFITGSLTIKQYIKENSSPQPEPSFWKKSSARKKAGIIVGVAAMLVALVTLTVLLNVLPNGQSQHVGDGDDDRLNIPIASTIEADQTSAGTALRIVPRGQWIAQPPNNILDKLVLPVNRVIIQHTATDNCTTQSSCVFRVRYIQNFHMESENFDDIGYNFLVGGDGAVYEGRGWDSQGAHTRGYNKGSIGIAFIGTFTKYAPPARQLNVAKLLLEDGVRLKKLTPDYKLYGHRQFYGTESPGETLFQILTTWKHWANDVV